MEKKSVSRSEELRKEARQLKRELLAAKQKKLENAAKQAEKMKRKWLPQMVLLPNTEEKSKSMKL